MTNIYSAPTADLSAFQHEGDTYQPTVFQLKGRIGRVRYLAYSVCTTTLMSIVGGILAVMFPRALPAYAILALTYIPMIAVSLILVVRRLHDLDRNGWLSLLMLIPFLNFLFGLYLLFAAGSEEANQYGPPPSPNTTLVVVGAWIVPIVFVVGILAAVAIPAYQQYVTRAQLVQ